MKLYTQADFDGNEREKRRQCLRTLALMLPFLAAAAAAFALRLEALCIAGLVAAGSIGIFLYDLRIGPALRYGRYLAQAHGGLTRRTAGALVRIGEDRAYQDGVYFREVILNIYEDMTQEGERRFLLDERKEIPQAWIGRDVAVVSHGSFLLEIDPMEAQA